MPKPVMGSLRLSRFEERVLVRRFGTVSAGLRGVLNEWLRVNAPQEPVQHVNVSDALGGVDASKSRKLGGE